MSKVIYSVRCEDDYGEYEGMIDEDGNILDIWSNNDATWRDEYFNGFMAELGITVKSGTAAHRKILKKQAKELWG